MYTYPDYLEHHGILGMHWGIRQYQNKNGSLTSKGKALQDKRNKKASIFENKASKNQRDIDELKKNYNSNNTLGKIQTNLKISSLTRKKEKNKK